MEKMKFETPDMTAENIEKIAKLFPNCVTEMRDESGKIKRGINFEMLKQMLSPDVVDGDECYEFTWVGKKASVVEAYKPIRKTLRPCPEESKDWDTTENLYIEGDNLEVLKLLQESYLGKVKMIYIDPPYNTGNDFIYADDFMRSQEEENEQMGMYDEDKNRLFKNTDSNGRFHSDWCSMMYPRLMLARNLLADDGVIFISIDDNEQENLKKLCDEVFGGFLNDFIWLNNLKGRQISKGGAVKTYEHILCYAKKEDEVKSFVGAIATLQKDMPSAYRNLQYEIFYDKKGAYVIKNELYNTNTSFNEETRPNLVFNILYDPKTEEVCLRDMTDEISEYEKNKYVIFSPHKNSNMKYKYHAWRWSKEKITKEQEELYFDCDNLKIYTKIRNYSETNIKDIITDIGNGNSEIESLLGKKVFSFPKSIKLLRLLCSTVLDPQDIILDFFSGSATTAHAVMQLNAEDGGHRKFIMVQLPELCDEQSEAYNAGYKNICEIGKERIRRAGEKIKAENPLTTQDFDVGFRVLKLADSNMKDVYYAADEYTQSSLMDMISNIKDDRTDLDLLFGCLIDWGVPLSMPYKSEQLDGCTVHVYNDGDLVACFDDNVPESVVKEIAKRKPLRAVFRDSGFADSPSKINVFEIFKLYMPEDADDINKRVRVI